MKNIFRDIEENFQARQLILCFLLTGLFLFFSFIGYTSLSTVEITIQYRGSETVHISYYGYPFEMIGILTPIGSGETGWVTASGEGLFRILWAGLVVNFILYFLLAFAVVYFGEKVKRLTSRRLSVAAGMFLPVEGCAFS
jgi:hypothetical protein